MQDRNEINTSFSEVSCVFICNKYSNINSLEKYEILYYSVFWILVISFINRSIV